MDCYRIRFSRQITETNNHDILIQCPDDCDSLPVELLPILVPLDTVDRDDTGVLALQHCCSSIHSIQWQLHITYLHWTVVVQMIKTFRKRYSENYYGKLEQNFIENYVVSLTKGHLGQQCQEK